MTEPKVDKIYVNFKHDSLTDLLYKLFDHRGYIIVKSVATYSDEQCTQIQCYAGKNRSFDDLMILVNTYYEVDEMTLLKELLTLDIKLNNSNVYPYLIYCPDIHKPVINYAEEINGGLYQFSSNISSNNDNNKSDYCWIELLEELGINNISEYKEYCMKNRKVTELVNESK